MIQINEWLPSPAGLDARGEFVELFNGGDQPVNLGGWFLKTQGGSKAKLSGTISAGAYALFKRSATKLVLRNGGEKLFLYDARGNLADQSGFSGIAIEGESFSRPNYSEPASNPAKEPFVWADPTPGARNSAALDANITENNYPYGNSLNIPLSNLQFTGLLLGSSIVLTAIILYAFKKHENLSNLFFGRDEEARL